MYRKCATQYTHTHTHIEKHWFHGTQRATCWPAAAFHLVCLWGPLGTQCRHRRPGSLESTSAEILSYGLLDPLTVAQSTLFSNAPFKEPKNLLSQWCRASLVTSAPSGPAPLSASVADESWVAETRAGQPWPWVPLCVSHGEVSCRRPRPLVQPFLPCSWAPPGRSTAWLPGTIWEGGTGGAG